MHELISLPCCRQSSVRATGRDNASSSLSNFVHYCLSFNFHIPGKTAYRRSKRFWKWTGCAKKRWDADQCSFLNQKEWPYVCFPSWSLKLPACLASISGYVLLICQSDTGRCVESSWQKASSNPDKQRDGSWQLALFSCHLSRFVWHSTSSLYTEAGKAAMPILSQKKPTRQRQVKFITWH